MAAADPWVHARTHLRADNMMRLISVANILPKGLYVENAVRVSSGPRPQRRVGAVPSAAAPASQRSPRRRAPCIPQGPLPLPQAPGPFKGRLPHAPAGAPPYTRALVQVAKRELALECDYRHEAAAQARFRELVLADPSLAPHFNVPAVVPELCTGSVLTTHWVPGVHIDQVRCGAVRCGAGPRGAASLASWPLCAAKLRTPEGRWPLQQKVQ